MTDSTAAPSRLDPALFGEGPARDDRFTVVDVWAEMVNLPDGHRDKQREFFHRQMNEEACVMENAARSLAEFPDADWRVRKGLARQCADEARHVLSYRRLLEARGGHLGQYPVMNFQYRILGRIDSLVGRLAIQNRSFEADGLDAATYARDEARQAGDHELADMYDAQQADEVCHIRLGNDLVR
ncbi:MAG: ferritin-like domain-containing protein, partial [Gemmatimonadota bacterium]|nr:ferritin-like domain-containing protein [Gemmatimonadota bacterium]